MTIKINDIQEIPVDLFYNGDRIGVITSGIQFDDVRLQIKQNQIEGYYVIFKNIRIDINKHGKVSCWPRGFFDTWGKILFELLNNEKTTRT